MCLPPSLSHPLTLALSAAASILDGVGRSTAADRLACFVQAAYNAPEVLISCLHRRADGVMRTGVPQGSHTRTRTRSRAVGGTTCALCVPAASQLGCGSATLLQPLPAAPNPPTRCQREGPMLTLAYSTRRDLYQTVLPPCGRKRGAAANEQPWQLR
jgi:hypothetical protein